MQGGFAVGVAACKSQDIARVWLCTGQWCLDVDTSKSEELRETSPVWSGYASNTSLVLNKKVELVSSTGI